MTPEDMAQLHAASFTTPRPWSAVEFAALLAGPGAYSVEDPQGFALGRVVAGEAELLTVAVWPEARRGGIGRALLSGFESRARDGGATYAFLEVVEDNLPAIALYRGAGWHEAGRRRAYYRTPEGNRLDAVVMAKSLG